ncbi:3-methyl-2-oxobutanoate hydroxymethyltransferase [Limnoglobus roseus]|uniref:3-methyl-2-oxobutanoate hydroxymethyltransferase n=1 Tax=Limnoglobus roseus TaxID=2598579 RepID=A0A5C1AD85_9BACT|nr:3-methyl-2-oxobutanoate hydroxymethyltransferase [Limnoglobus roseus]QEL15966.1 3-methyl-2-oxobutanoate hydroxymethyltransferase [Limnoglobus roseus]
MSSIPPPVKPVTVPEFRSAKGQRKLAVVTGYDYTAARLLDAAGVDCILVGDSLGMVMQGHPNPLPVTLPQMLYHVQCVLRGTKRALVIGDLPFLSYHESPRQAVRNAGKFLKAGAAGVKLEGGERMAEQIAACVRADIPVMGHVGLTPQSVQRFGGFKVQRNAAQIVADAKAVEQAGAFSLVIESVPPAIAEEVTKAVSIPTIGIGAGAECDGQVLVFHDLLGLFPDFRPKFVKAFAELGTAVTAGVSAYCQAVRDGTFPGPEHTFK